MFILSQDQLDDARIVAKSILSVIKSAQLSYPREAVLSGAVSALIAEFCESDDLDVFSAVLRREADRLDAEIARATSSTLN